MSFKEIDKIVKFIQEEVNHAGKKGCVVGISGGIDSAVVACLCKKAFPDTTLGISMPMEDNIDGETSKRAKELANKLKLDMNYIIHPIQKLNENYQDKIKGNYYARQRMVKLYLYAEADNCLVIGTDNKCENYIGYFTKFGDGGVDINPIGQFYKSEVYELGRLLEVPKSILEATPSAELWDGQTDEDEIGFTYPQLESAIKFLKKEYTPKPSKEIFKYFMKVCSKVDLMHRSTQHKRMIPKEYNRILNRE